MSTDKQVFRLTMTNGQPYDFQSDADAMEWERARQKWYESELDDCIKNGAPPAEQPCPIARYNAILFDQHGREVSRTTLTVV